MVCYLLRFFLGFNGYVVRVYIYVFLPLLIMVFGSSAKFLMRLSDIPQEEGATECDGT